MKIKLLLLLLVVLPIKNLCAGTSQVLLAMSQARSAMVAFTDNQPELGRQHVLAARSHADVALRGQTGQVKTRLKESINQLEKASAQAEKGKSQTALGATEKAIKALQAIETQ
jgi:hypothetical protein